MSPVSVGREVLFDWMCRDNGIVHRLIQPRHPTTTGKIERFRCTLADEWAYARRLHHRNRAPRRTCAPWLHTYNHYRGCTALKGQPPASRVTNLSGQNMCYELGAWFHRTVTGRRHRVFPAARPGAQAPSTSRVRTESPAGAGGGLFWQRPDAEILFPARAGTGPAIAGVGQAPSRSGRPRLRSWTNSATCTIRW